jgi:hypothetical protein
MNAPRTVVTGGLLAVALAACGTVAAQIADSPDEAVAGIPVNYTEAKVGLYTLPDPLTLEGGETVADARTWYEQRRPEILRLVEANQFGRAPGRPAELTFEVFDTGTPAFGGRAQRKQVTIYFTTSRSEHYVDLLVYLPAKASGPVPLLLQVGWGPNNLAVEDQGVKVGRTWDARTKTRTPATEGRRFGAALNVVQLVERGYGVAVFNYHDIDPDSLDAIAHGVRAAYLKEGAVEPAADEWGSISAWAWGISRMIDYFETDPQVDARRIAITGASRLGKTVLWAGARDERIALVIASVSGEGGAALSRRHYGETVAHLVAPTRYPYQFARNYATWAGRMTEAPFDAHFIISLIAPRPLLLQTGYTDKWSDPYGELLAAKAATPVYELLGRKGIETPSQPRLGEPLMNTLGYLMHDGGHGVLPADWLVFLDFMDRHLAPHLDRGQVLNPQFFHDLTPARSTDRRSASVQVPHRE